MPSAFGALLPQLPPGARYGPDGQIIWSSSPGGGGSNFSFGSGGPGDGGGLNFGFQQGPTFPGSGDNRPPMGPSTPGDGITFGPGPSGPLGPTVPLNPPNTPAPNRPSPFRQAAPYLDLVGQVLAAIAAGRAQGRRDETDQVLRGDSVALARAETERRNYQQAIRDAMLAQLLGGLTDVEVAAPAGIPMGTVTGGLRPSALPNTEMMEQILNANGMAGMRRPPRTPAASPLPESNNFDLWAAILAPLLAGLGAAGQRP
jgi:hypothetical protein